MDSNHRPTDYESAALTAVLRARCGYNLLDRNDLSKRNDLGRQSERERLVSDEFRNVRISTPAITSLSL